MTLAEYLGPRLSLPLARSDGERRELAARLPTLERAGADDLGPKRIALLVAILRAEFGQLFEQWFGLTVEAFLRHPLARVLMQALGGELDAGFFIGHCALVLRLRDGAHSDAAEAQPWIIEANATDFANYGVRMRPYVVDPPEDGRGDRHRSWSARRASRGNFCWHARHAAMDGGDDAARQAASEALVVHAMRYLGRSYSFFDSPQFADDARLYCSEFVFRAFDDSRLGLQAPPRPALERLDDRRRWGWMKANNPPDSPIGRAIAAVWADSTTRNHVFPPEGHPEYHPQGRPFFILTVQMLWRSAWLVHPLQPGGADYDAP
jgi:cell wall-associated NlpC family hydrolase